jgi:hypothetical protein
LEVHLPHKPIDSWKEFFVHLITITIGLLIALGLEGSVEWMHHRHLMREARTNIRQEIVDNQEQVQKNLRNIQEDEERMKQNLQFLVKARSHADLKNQTLSFSLSWSSFNASAWESSRDTGALSYMEYKDVKDFSDVYGQQELANSIAVNLFHEQVKAIAPLFINGGEPPHNNEILKESRPEEINVALQRSADLLLELNELEQIVKQLNDQYSKTLKEI